MIPIDSIFLAGTELSSFISERWLLQLDSRLQARRKTKHQSTTDFKIAEVEAFLQELCKGFLNGSYVDVLTVYFLKSFFVIRNEKIVIYCVFNKCLWWHLKQSLMIKKINLWYNISFCIIHIQTYQSTTETHNANGLVVPITKC